MKARGGSGRNGWAGEIRRTGWAGRNSRHKSKPSSTCRSRASCMRFERAATVMSPCGVVNCKAFGPLGSLLTNRMTQLVTYGSVGGVGRNPGPYPAGNGARASLLQTRCCWRAVPEAERYRDVKLHSPLFGWSNPDQALRVAAGIPGKRASGGTTWALQVRCQRCEAFPTMHRTWKPHSGVELESEDMVKTN